MPTLRWQLWEHRARQLAAEHSGDFAGFAEAAKSLGNGIAFTRSGSGSSAPAGNRSIAPRGKLVTDGVYAYVRHPQYTGIFVITLAFMVQWPTLTTFILWPFVIAMYVRLARKEERGVLEQHPKEYRAYMERTPMFVPRLRPRSEKADGT